MGESNPATIPVEVIRGVGKARAQVLRQLGIRTVADLLWYVPRRYEDRTRIVPFSQLPVGERVTTCGRVILCEAKTAPGREVFEAILEDDHGERLTCRWFRLPFLKSKIRPGDALFVTGKLQEFQRQRILNHPEYEKVESNDGSLLSVGRLVPFYAVGDALPQKVMRRIVWEALQAYGDRIAEILPVQTRTRHGLMAITEAVREIHFPTSSEKIRTARFRLAFEEFLPIQLILVAQKLRCSREGEGIAHDAPGVLMSQFLSRLPFALTAEQRRVLEEILRDLRTSRPMHRLLHGEVGAGKTVIALCAALQVVESGSQCAILVPTEVLAIQHFETLQKYVAPLGVKIALLTGGDRISQRQELLNNLRSGDLQIVVGTHALLGPNIAFNRLGLVIIDEQHKFGVSHRAALYRKGIAPDVLIMTATPIPRTLAMTIYGDLDVSVLREKPTGRGKVVTRVTSMATLPKVYEFVGKQIKSARQAIFVYPVLESTGDADLRSAKAMYQHLRERVFPYARIGLLHGRMSTVQKAEVLQRFATHQLDLLVATTVVEVGVDVPRANLLVVIHAERFGLAQLHQLRGRVSRSPEKSFCVFCVGTDQEEALERLRILEKTTDGFAISEMDMRWRGMGDLLGKRQSGWWKFRVADVLADHDALESARREAFILLETDPRLSSPEFDLLRERVRELVRSGGRFFNVG